MLARIVLAALAVALVPASPAFAATQIGQLSTAGASGGCGAANLLVWQTSATHQAPARGVLTQLRTSSGTAGPLVSIKVVRPSGAPAILFSTAPLTVTSAGDIVSVDVRVRVEQGDVIGFWLGTADNMCARPAGPGDAFSAVLDSADQPAGPIAGTIASEVGAQLAVAATWEPDADGDGFGDDSQDGCPSDPAITSGGCTADAGLSGTATPASIEVGDVAVIDLSVANPGPATLRGAALAAAIPPGLAGVLVTPRSCALTAAFSCALGDFGAGSREAALVVRGMVPGNHAIAVALSMSTTDPNVANNAVSVPLTVTPRSQRACKVPRLKGRKKRFAAALLKAAGCKLGTTKTRRVRRGKSGRVLAQGTKAGTTVPLGTAVAVTLSRRVRR